MKTTTLKQQYTFLKEWQPYAKKYNEVKNKMLKHFLNHVYQYQPTHEKSSAKDFTPYSFTQIDKILGLAYTSTGDYAGLWVCNGGYLWADDTHYFQGFAITTDNKVIAIAQDYDENEIYIVL